MAFFKDDPELTSKQLPPDQVITDLPPGDTRLGKLARTYNRIGGLLEAFSLRTGVSVRSALAVWYVESGGAEFTKDRPILRFENHKFWQHWGKSNETVFDRHFEFGGHKGIDGKPWKNHRFRAEETGSFTKFHGSQSDEYKVFEFAVGLGGLDAAVQSSSFGGPQILGSNYKSLGYASAIDLFNAFKISERAHVLGFFDFCNSNNIIDEAKKLDFRGFAKAYNGIGQADTYAQLIEDAYTDAGKLDELGKAPPTPAAVGAEAPPASAFNLSDFTAYIDSLGLRHFKAYELLFKGNQHGDSESPAFGLNTDPPKALWSNIVSTIKLLDELRERLAAPIVLISLYRSPAYNKVIAGATGSQHMKFNAIDFVVRNHMSPDSWAAVLKDMRASGMFRGGIGTYSSFVHVDTRGTNATW